MNTIKGIQYNDSNVYPVTEYHSNVFPYMVLAWIVLEFVLCNKFTKESNVIGEVNIESEV